GCSLPHLKGLESGWLGDAVEQRVDGREGWKGGWLLGGAKSKRGRGQRPAFSQRLRRPRPATQDCRGVPLFVLGTSRHVRGEEPEEVGDEGSPGGAWEAEREREEPRSSGWWRQGLGRPLDRREPAVAGDVPGPGLCQKSEVIIEQLKAFQIITHLKHLQEEIYEVKTWSSRISEKQDILNNNLTTVSQDVAKVDQSTTSMAKDVGLKITTIKTDIRRMSGLVTDVTSLTDSVQELENKIEKVEKNTVKNIGDLLSSSIDRTAMLRKTASENSQRINSVKKILSELQGDFNKHTDRLLSLESDRAKVLKTVTFANDLKPKVYNLKKDFSRLEPLVNDLTLRIGRLVTDLLQREKEIAFLKEKISNLTIVRAEIKDMKDEIKHISDMD
uniref:Inhibitor of nuclear factor kappa-B kinase-interacting protein n=1 Tax=Moschus moschiferus TaxID=68415 RepID=A0A8C6G245_MOSMO